MISSLTGLPAAHSRSLSIVPPRPLPKLKLLPSTTCVGRTSSRRMCQNASAVRLSTCGSGGSSTRSSTPAAASSSRFFSRGESRGGARSGRRTVSGCGSNVTTASRAPGASSRFAVSMILRCPRCRPSKFPTDSTPPGASARRPSRPLDTLSDVVDAMMSRGIISEVPTARAARTLCSDARHANLSEEHAMKRIFATTTAALLLLATGATMASAAIKTETVEYKQGDTTLKGFLAYDDASTDKRPAVIIVHEWWGVTDYTKRRAHDVASLGYVAFVADMFGDGKTTNDPTEAGKLAGGIK